MTAEYSHFVMIQCRVFHNTESKLTHLFTSINLQQELLQPNVNAEKKEFLADTRHEDNKKAASAAFLTNDARRNLFNQLYEIW